MRLRVVLFILVCSVAAIWGEAPLARAESVGRNAKARKKAGEVFHAQIQPFLNTYCFSCHGNGKHKGDVALDQWPDTQAMMQDRKMWELVMQKVVQMDMPPKGKPQPTNKEREALSQWVQTHVFQCDCDNPDPGRVTIRRLNRVEYNNTIRDLTGINFQPAEDFPADDSGYGFDNIGDVLSVPPLLLEKYLAAAQKITEAAISVRKPSVVKTNHYPLDLLEIGYNAKQRGDGSVSLTSVEEDDLTVHYDAEKEGDYAIRVKAWAEQGSTRAMTLTFMNDKKPIAESVIETNKSLAHPYAAMVHLRPGKHRLRVVVRRIKDGLSADQALKWKSGELQKGAVIVEYLEVAGPLDPPPETLPALHRRYLAAAIPPEKQEAAARTIIKDFAQRAYRRPVTAEEVGRLERFPRLARERGESFEKGIQIAFQAILTSPHFLFRGELEPEPDNPKKTFPIDEYALASRLSYFLWSSMPDDRLFALAARKSLRRNVEPEVRRMLKDPKANALVEDFAGQWLQLRNVKLITPDPEAFPNFDESLREAMQKETELFFANVMREDRSVLDFLEGDYTFVNERLAKHYDLPGVQGADFRKVSLAGTQRRGLLTQASILAVTSNPTRTSPVKRGKWVLENLLNAPPPPPPPNVPALSESKEKVLSGSLRQRMEQHRSDPICASCHTRMDAIGFGLENFDATGAWRTKDANFAIDPAGELAPGEDFAGPMQLAKILNGPKRDAFVRCLTDKMLTYALGRGMEYYDKCAIDQITERVGKKKYRFSALVLEIVKSVPFEQRRGDGPMQTASK